MNKVLISIVLNKDSDTVEMSFCKEYDELVGGISLAMMAFIRLMGDPEEAEGLLVKAIAIAKETYNDLPMDTSASEPEEE